MAVGIHVFVCISHIHLNSCRISSIRILESLRCRLTGSLSFANSLLSTSWNAFLANEWKYSSTCILLSRFSYVLYNNIAVNCVCMVLYIAIQRPNCCSSSFCFRHASKQNLDLSFHFFLSSGSVLLSLVFFVAFSPLLLEKRLQFSSGYQWTCNEWMRFEFWCADQGAYSNLIPIVIKLMMIIFSTILVQYVVVSKWLIKSPIHDSCICLLFHLFWFYSLLYLFPLFSLAIRLT